MKQMDIMMGMTFLLSVNAAYLKSVMKACFVLTSNLYDDIFVVKIANYLLFIYYFTLKSHSNYHFFYNKSIPGCLLIVIFQFLAKTKRKLCCFFFRE